MRYNKAERISPIDEVNATSIKSMNTGHTIKATNPAYILQEARDLHSNTPSQNVSVSINTGN